MHLSDYMSEHQLTDDAVADKINRSRATVSRIRRGKVRPDWDTIKALSDFSRGRITANDFVDLSQAGDAA